MPVININNDDIRLNSSSSDKVVVNGNFGIGTTSPGAPLHVYKNDTYSAIISRADWNSGTSTKLALGKQYGVLGFISSDLVETTNDTSYIALNYKNSLTTYAEGLRVYNNGNVGIGTTSPASKLDVVGSGAYDGVIRVRSTSTNTPAAVLGVDAVSSADGYVGTLNNWPFQIRTNDVGRIHIDTSGNVGIGTTAPTYKLDVVGTSYFSGLAHFGQSATGGSAFRWGPYGTAVSSDTMLCMNQLWNGGGWTILDSGVGTTYLNLGSNSASPNITFGTGPANTVATVKMIILNNGDVGIGTTSPGSKLDVYLPEGSYVRATNASSVVGAGNHWGFGLYEGTALSAAFRIVRDGTADQVSIGTANNQPFAFWQNNTERMRIAVGGNVGIGTTSPSYKLDVAGTSRSDLHIFRSNQSAPTADAFIFRPADNTVALGTANSERIRVGSSEVWFKIGSSTTGYEAAFTNDDNGFNIYASRYGGTGKYLTLNSTGAVENMRLTSNGNVGIGTTSPSYKLDVQGNAGGITISTNGAIITGTEFITGSGILAASSSGTDVAIKAGASTLMTLKSGGNVLIGTTTDSGYKLDVIGSARVSNANGLTISGFNTDTGLRIDYGNASGQISVINLIANGATNGYIGLQMVDSSNGDMWFGSRPAGRTMTIYRDGNVGIGTTAPNEKLDVNGDVTLGWSANRAFKIKFYGGGTFEAGMRLASGTRRLELFSIFDNSAEGISFTTGTGASNSEKMRLTDAGNLGIGTTAPAYKLDVVGAPTTNDWGLRLQNTNTGGWGVSQFFNIYGYASSPASDFSALQIRADYPGYGRISFVVKEQAQSSALESLVLRGNGQVYMNAGNVGIGTTSPSRLFDVSAVNPQMTLKSTTTTGFSEYYFSDSAGDPGYLSYAHNGDYLSIGVNSAERMRITSAGNVGIGTTSPSYNLHIVGTGYASQYFASDYYRDSRLEAMLIYAGSNQIRLGSGVGSDFLTFYGGGNERMRIDSSGNVGIGTTSPAGKLDVRAGAGGKIIFGSYDANYNITIEGGDQLNFYNGASATTGYINYNGPGNILISRNLYVEGNSSGGTSGAVRITSAGNVGIGTTSPYNALTINRDTSAGTVSSIPGIAFKNRNNTNSIFVHSGIFADTYRDVADPHYSGGIWFTRNPEVSNLSSSSDIVFGTGFNVGTGLLPSERMRITSSGNVGIGTASPTEKLHVDGSVVVTYNNSYQGINSVGNKAILARVSPTTGIINYAEYATAANLNGFVMGSDDARVKGNIATDSLEFITNGSTQVTVLSNGNVGIANTNPSEKLSVTGNIRMDNGAADGPQLVLGSSGFSDWNIDNFSGSLRAYYGSTEYTRLTSSGNFGIGVTPSYKLDVAGDTRITSGSLGVGVVPNATDGRIDASNDIVAYSSSDRRLKENITPIANALDKVKSLTGVEFDWKPEHKKAHGYEGHDTGVIAQEVQEVMPTAVRTNDTGYLAVRYEKLIGLLIEANKELAARVEELENKLK